MPRRLLAPALALATVLFVACGGGQAAAPTDSTPNQPAATIPAVTQPSAAAEGGGVLGDKQPGTALDACEIVTSADVKAATKAMDVSDGKLKASPTTLSPGQTECTYTGAFGKVIVELTPEDGANLYDAARGAYDDASDITGSWDGAFNSKEHNRAFVWKGNVTAMFTMFLTDGEQLPVATELAKRVVAKLQ
jgi:hypothetical protein